MITKLQNIVTSLYKVKFVRDILTLQAGSVFGSGIGLLKSVLFARMLGLEGFGTYAVILAYTGTFGLLTNIGQNQAAITFFAEGYEKKDLQQMSGVMKYYLQVVMGTTLILLALIVITPAAIEILYEDPSIGAPAQLYFIAIIAGLLNELFIVLLQTVRKIKTLTVIENLNQLFQLLFAVVFLFSGYGFFAPFIGICIGNILTLIILLFEYRKMKTQYALPSIKKSLLSTHSTKEYWKQGLWIAADKNIGGLFPQGFLFIMSIFTTPSIVGIARLAYNTSNLPSQLVLAHANRLAGTVLPGIAAKGHQALRTNCAKLIKHALAVHSIGTFASLVILPIAAIIVYGVEYSAMVTPLLWLLLIKLVSGLNIANTPLFRVFRKTHIPAIFNAISISLELLLFWALLDFVHPINAFVGIVAIRLTTNLWLNWYLYTEIRATKS